MPAIIIWVSKPLPWLAYSFNIVERFNFKFVVGEAPTIAPEQLTGIEFEAADGIVLYSNPASRVDIPLNYNPKYLIVPVPVCITGTLSGYKLGIFFDA